MRVPRSSSVIWDNKITVFQKSTNYDAKMHFPEVFFHGRLGPAEGRRIFFLAGGRAYFDLMRISAGGREFFQKLPGDFGQGAGRG